MIPYLKWFWQLWKRTKIRMLLVILATIATMATKTAYPIFLKLIVDEMSGDYQVDSVYKLIIFFILFSIANEFLAMGLPFLRGYLNLLYASMVRNHYYKIVTQKSHRFFKKFKTGDLITRLTDDIDGSWIRIFWYACSGILRPLEAFLILGLSLGVMAYYSVPLTLYSFLPIPFLVFALSRIEEKMLKYTIEKQEVTSECNNILDSCFSGIRVIKSTRSEKYYYGEYKKAVDNRVEKEKKFLKINQILHFLTMMTSNIGCIVVIFVGGIYVTKNAITLGTLLLFITYLQSLIEPLWTLSFFYASSKQVFKYVDRLTEIDDFEIDDESLNIQPNKNHYVENFNSLTLSNLSFNFHDDPRMIFKDINLTIKKGESVAIMGEVGSGKSSLLELITGELSPQKGKILLNDHPIEHIDGVGDIIGYIRQENLLFSESIKDNLNLSKDYNDKDIKLFLKTSLIENEINSFPKGINTILGQRGITLSGGQKQRLSIARTLIRRPQLLLMDDCTAAMDARTEKLFWKGLKKEFTDLSYIVVTHRQVTANQADRIFKIEDCQLVEITGLHDPNIKQSPEMELS